MKHDARAPNDAVLVQIVQIFTKKHNGVNPVNGKSLDDLYQRTQDKIRYIKDQGYNVMEMWECQWQASNKRDPELSRFIKNRKQSG
jgi:hypothetical protein